VGIAHSHKSACSSRSRPLGARKARLPRRDRVSVASGSVATSMPTGGPGATPPSGGWQVRVQSVGSGESGDGVGAGITRAAISADQGQATDRSRRPQGQWQGRTQRHLMPALVARRRLSPECRNGLTGQASVVGGCRESACLGLPVQRRARAADPARCRRGHDRDRAGSQRAFGSAALERQPEVDDSDTIAARAAELGGSVLMPPIDTPGFRSAVLLDPQEGAFSVSHVMTGA